MPVQTIQSDWVPIGYARFGTLSSAITVGSTAPTAGTAYGSLTLNGLSVQPRRALIDAETQNVRVRDDGTAPTGTEGQLIKAAATAPQEVIGTDAIRNLKIIEAAVSAAVTIRYYV